MLYKIEFTMKSAITVACDSEAEAQAKGQAIADDSNKHSHHGERTTFKVIQIEEKA